MPVTSWADVNWRRPRIFSLSHRACAPDPRLIYLLGPYALNHSLTGSPLVLLVLLLLASVSRNRLSSCRIVSVGLSPNLAPSNFKAAKIRYKTPCISRLSLLSTPTAKRKRENRRWVCRICHPPMQGQAKKKGCTAKSGITTLHISCW